ncbi:O-antigen ligase family protein [Rhodovibrio salinarum]|uniref:O-antigen ligase-related domain-containing protein n=1 Tax=Rhodovibrio salinarum TaxID=1087 RepID=A0A934QG60_9PROT|nr:O-antigen ligase family protein [Rhodovibrio salinarum]MBK1696382.1 hypothetical protein [Rhodovibrio salinarum]
MVYARPEPSLAPTGGSQVATRHGVTDHPVAQILFYGILFTIPFFRFRDLPGPFFMKVDYLLTAGLLLIVVPAILVQKLPPKRLHGNIWMPVGLFMLTNLASAILSPYPDTAFQGLVILIAFVIFMTINLVMINDRGVETWLPAVLIASTGLNAALASLGYYLGVDYFVEGGRGYGGTISANNMALMCVYVLPLAVYWGVMGSTPIRRVIGLAGAVLLLLGLISTESRGGFVNLVAVALLLAVQFRHHFHPRYLGLVVGGASALLAVVVLFVPQEYIQRQATLQLMVEWVTGEGQELAEDAALDRRASYVEVALEAFPEHPVLGTGPDTFKKIWVDSDQARWFAMTERPAHNTYLEVLIGTGIVGLATFLALLWVTYRNYLGAERLLRQHGDEIGAHLVGAYKIAFLSVLIYFLVKSGIDHKYFILALPLSVAVQRYAQHRLGLHQDASAPAHGVS